MVGCAFRTAETKAYSNAGSTDPGEGETRDTRLKGVLSIGNGGWNLEIGLSVAEALAASFCGGSELGWHEDSHPGRTPWPAPSVEAGGPTSCRHFSRGGSSICPVWTTGCASPLRKHRSAVPNGSGAEQERKGVQRSGAGASTVHLLHRHR